MPKHPVRIVELAKRGAEARLQDLIYEATLLLRLFPHLKDSFDKDELPISFIVARGSGRLTKKHAAGRRPRAARRKGSASRRRP